MLFMNTVRLVMCLHSCPLFSDCLGCVSRLSGISCMLLSSHTVRQCVQAVTSWSHDIGSVIGVGKEGGRRRRGESQTVGTAPRCIPAQPYLAMFDFHKELLN